jgi:hypothetical protein
MKTAKWSPLLLGERGAAARHLSTLKSAQIGPKNHPNNPG